VAYWLKLGYFTAAQEGKSDYWMGRTWVSDGPGRKSPRWNQRQAPKRGELHPPFGPQYEIGDRLVVYVTGRGVCQAILEVEAEPRWDPEWVDDNGAEGEGDQWGVVTDVQGLWSLGIDDAPLLEEIGLAPSSVQRKGHIQLEDWQYRLAEGLIAGDGAPSALVRPAVAMNVDVPVEQHLAEGYEIAPASAIKRASRRESALVGDFQAHLEGRGDKVSRNRLTPPEANSMHTDLFNQSRGQLIEAKADSSRHSIRMAIGQLADYRRFIKGVTGTAVLLGAKPHPDLLNLLDLQGIVAIWRSGEGFTDSAAGAFV
jgi:hypothetical protein